MRVFESKVTSSGSIQRMTAHDSQRTSSALMHLLKKKRKIPYLKKTKVKQASEDLNKVKHVLFFPY